MSFAAEQHADLVSVTLGAMDKVVWTDLVPELQEYYVLNKFCKKNKKKETGGKRIEFTLRVNSNRPARHEKINQTETPTTSDLFNREANVPWRHSSTYWAIDERVADMNSDPEAIASLIEGNRIDAMQDMAELMEGAFFTAPMDSADLETPWGLAMWMQTHATAGFNGANPSGFADMAGVDSSNLYPKWRNYTGAFATRQFGDMTELVKDAMHYTSWRPAVRFPSNTGESMNDSEYDPDRFSLLTTYLNQKAFERQAMSQNDNLGKDLLSMDGQVMIRNCNIMQIPWLTENDTTHKIYGLDWKTWTLHILKNWWMKEKVIKNYPGHRNMSVTFYDCTYNWVCRNRRRNFVLYYSGV